LATGKMGLDALMNLASLSAMTADQAAVDQRLLTAAG
jgi:hypothetical protein